METSFPNSDREEVIFENQNSVDYEEMIENEEYEIIEYGF